MHLFIDANILLDFYHLTSVDLEELRKLIALIEDGTVVLYSNQQLRDEIERNRDSKISDAMKHFQASGSSLKMTFPAFCKSFPEFTQIQALLKEANTKHAELYKKAMVDVNARTLGADGIIKDLLARATNIDLTEKIFNIAIRRLRLGNPPGKKKVTIGDEVNWEALLAGVPENEDLYLVSGDSDYASPFIESEASSFLRSEWAARKNSTLHFYRNISDFFRDKFPKIKIASDVRTMRLIEGLAASGSFSTTHLMIGQLGTVDEFSISQAEELVDILCANTQVSWIIEDADVSKFYRDLKDKYSAKLPKEKRTKLEELLAPKDEDPFAIPEMDDEIPF